MAKYLKFPEDPYDQLIWLMEAIGELKSDKFSLSNRLMSVAVGLLTVNGWLGPIVFAVTSGGPAGEKGEIILHATSGLHICTKFYNNYLRQKETRRLLKLTKSLWDKKRINYWKKMKVQCDKRCSRTMKALFATLNSLVLLMIVKGILLNLDKDPDDWKLPFPCWLPLDSRKWFFTNCIWETITLSIEMLSVSVHYSFLYLTIIQASAQMDVLAGMMESPGLQVKDSIKLHIKIMRLVKYLNEIHAGQMAFEMFLYGLQVATSGFFIMKFVRTQAGLGSLAFCIYVFFLYISFSYLLCLGGHEITIQSEKVYTSICQSRWYELSVEEQKILGVMLCVASKNLQIRYKGLVTFSMERYGQMLQATYSYLTVLSGMDL